MDLLEGCITHFDDKLAALSHDIRLIIKSVQKRFKQGILTEQDSFRLAKIELCFIRLLIYDRQVPAALESFLASSPELFVDVLKKTYLPNKEEQDHLNYIDEESDDSINSSSFYSLLSHWQRLPGETDEQGETGERIDNTALERWVEQSRELARTCARLGSCDLQIGQLLARRSLSILRGQLPPNIFLTILQTIGTESILEGFRVGLLNGRGATIRSPFDGGEQERTLSKHYEKLADECRCTYPKVSQVFNNLANEYTFHAEREDEQAKRNKLF